MKDDTATQEFGPADSFNMFDTAVAEGATLVKLEDELTPDLPASAKSKAGLKGKAEKAATALDKAEKAMKNKVLPGLDIVMEILSHDEELLDLGEPPSWDEVSTDPNHSPVIQEMHGIVEKYKSGEFNLEQSRADVLRLGAYQIHLSECLSVYQAQVADARARYERTKTLAYVKAKKTARAERAKLSDTDAKEVARAFALPVAEQVANLEFVERYLFNAFHSLRNFQELLNFVAAREARAAAQPLTLPTK